MGSALAGEAGRAYCVYVHDPQSTSPLTDALSPLMRQQASRLMVLGLVVGLLGGLGAVVCDLLAHAIAGVALGVQDPSSEPPTFWRALLAPAAGGLIASVAMSLFVTKGRPVGVADVVESVALAVNWSAACARGSTTPRPSPVARNGGFRSTEPLG